MPVIVPQPPAKETPASTNGCICFGNRCEAFPEISWQFNPIAGANVTLTGTYPDITFAASGGGGTTNNYIVQSLTAQDGIDGQDGWPGPMGPAGVAGAAGRAGPPGMDGMDGMDGDGGYTSPPAPST